MLECVTCSGNGLMGGCPDCGSFNYSTPTVNDENVEVNFKIPMYYKKNKWDEDKIKFGDKKYANAIMTFLNKLVEQTASGGKIGSSYAILLPYGHGKKTAMFTIIQNYLAHDYTVAPVIDIASLAIIENNFKANDKKATTTWNELIEADLVCVYGVDFSARYLTMKLYLNLCSIRALHDKPTLLFAENSLAQLRGKHIADNLSEENNNIDNGSKLANPIIFDGVAIRRNPNV